MSVLVRAVAAFAVVLVTAGAVQGQNRYPVGVGVGLRTGPTILAFDEIELLSTMAPQAYITLVASDRVIVEPTIGLFRYSFDNGNGPFTSEGSAMVLRVGMGVYFASDAGDRGRVYYGPQAGIMRFGSEVTMRDFDGSETTDSESRVDLFLAGVAGGEFFLVERFSLGGEVGLEWMKQGDEGDDDESEFSSLATTAEVKVRWYVR